MSEQKDTTKQTVMVGSLTVREPYRPAHPFEEEDGGFIIMSHDGLHELMERVADRSLGVGALRVLVAMLTCLDYGNVALTAQKDLSRKLSMPISDISKAQRQLAEHGFIKKTGVRGAYYLNHRLVWKGSAHGLRTRRRDETREQMGKLLAVGER